MPSSQSIRPDASAVLSSTFLEVRGKLLEIAAVLDRIDRAGGAQAAVQDPRYLKLLQALEVLKGHADAVEVGRDTADGTSRAELIQLLFSRPYDPAWADALRMVESR